MPPEHLDVVRVGQRVGVHRGVAVEVEAEHGQGAGDGVQVGGDGGAQRGDLGRLVADRAVDGRLVVVHAADRAHVDQLQLVLGLYGVVDLEVAVQQVAAVQVAQCLQRLDAVGAGLFHRQRVAPALRRAAAVGDVLQRLAADVLHDDVTVEGPGPLVEVLDEVVDPHDVGVLDLGEEAPLGDGGGHRVLVAGVQQALEDDPPVGDRAVHGEVDPAESAVRQTAHHLVLAVHHVAAAQLGHEGVGVAALGAEPLGAAGAVAAGAAHGRAAVGAGAEPFALRHLRVVQHHGPGVGPRHGGHVDQARAQPAAARPARLGAGAAHRHRADRGGAAERPRQPAGDRPPGAGGRP